MTSGSCTLALCAIAAFTTACAPARETYHQAIVDAQGQLRIVTSGGVEIAGDKEAGQAGYDQIVISPNGEAVGWLALFPNCCTSYAIPLRLVVYTRGRHHVFSGNGLPVWRWAFLEDGRVAFRQETVHGGLGVHYELHDLARRRLIASFDPDSASTVLPPAWTVAVDSAGTKR